MTLDQLGAWLLPPLSRVSRWLADQACALDAYVDRWMEVLEL